jgi:catechol 2,3-dioxygenase-like lactoylglutathione lyase family enzyme
VGRLPRLIDHVKLPVTDLVRSREFYAAALKPLGYDLVFEGDESLGFGPPELEPLALERVDRVSTGTHVAFGCDDRETVDSFHSAALAAGGVDNGSPGPRPYGGEYYAAFVLDPDGHNLEAVYHG